MTTFAPRNTELPADLAECHDEVEDLRAALQTRPVIDQAKGMLIAEHGCSPDEAFDMISAASQRNNRKVRDIAEAMVDGAQAGGTRSRELAQQSSASHD
jgi:AmiR/NasT family two-component response regulator